MQMNDIDKGGVRRIKKGQEERNKDEHKERKEKAHI